MYTYIHTVDNVRVYPYYRAVRQPRYNIQSVCLKVHVYIRGMYVMSCEHEKLNVHIYVCLKVYMYILCRKYVCQKHLCVNFH